MTDNEKRAHDLAIAITSATMKPEFLINEPLEADGHTLIFNPYEKYQKAYKALLKAFDDDYPKGR